MSRIFSLANFVTFVFMRLVLDSYFMYWKDCCVEEWEEKKI